MILRVKIVGENEVLLFGIVELAQEYPVTALWFAHTLGQNGIIAWYYDFERSEMYGWDFEIDVMQGSGVSMALTLIAHIVLKEMLR